MNSDGEPADLHDARCLVWTSDDPAHTCTCRTSQGRTARDFTAGVDRVEERFERYAGYGCAADRDAS